MKVATIAARILLGLIFLVLGTNLLHPFLNGPMPTGVVREFWAGLSAVHMTELIGVVQILGGLLMLAGRYVTLGLIFLGPVIVCIDFFHLSASHSDLWHGVVVTILWILVALAHRRNLAGIFAARA